MSSLDQKNTNRQRCNLSSLRLNSGAMPIQRIDEVRPGAVLARPVEDSMGRVLINAGEALTEQLISVLRRRGFLEVEVRPQSVVDAANAAAEAAGSKSGPDEIAALRERISGRFARVPKQNERMRDLRQAVESVSVERLIAKRGLR